MSDGQSVFDPEQARWVRVQAPRSIVPLQRVGDRSGMRSRTAVDVPTQPAGPGRRAADLPRIDGGPGETISAGARADLDTPSTPRSTFLRFALTVLGLGFAIAMGFVLAVSIVVGFL